MSDFNRGVPANDAVTLRDMKDALVVMHSQDDALIERLTRAATSEFERFTDRTVIQRDHTMVVTARRFTGSIALRDEAVSITSVSFTLDDYTVVVADLNDVVLYQNTLCFVPDYVFPDGLLDVTVVYSAGMGTDDLDVPESVRQTIIDLASFRYEYRGTDTYELPKNVMVQLLQHRSEYL